MEQEKYVSKRKAPSKKQHAQMILNFLAKLQKEGMTPQEAVAKLSVTQYDFMIDYGEKLDETFLTENQLKVAQSMTKCKRPTDLNYKKKYPQNKQDLYIDLENFIKEQGAEIQAREKQNFRDLDFTLKETTYKIVLSTPRIKKE